jgi:acyl-CoA hydrolase/ribosomal protein S18 acetylase RimI-like enzyme
LDREGYRAKVCTPERAVREIKSGWRVLVGSGCSEPQTLVRAMADRAATLHDVEVVHLLTLGIAGYVGEEHAGRFRHNAFFIGSNVRQAVREGRADYTPIFLSEIPELIRSGQRPVQAVLLQLSPPDRHGFCSLGIAVDIQLAALESARLVVAEVNPRMPRTHGNTAVHVSRIHRVVEVDTPILELPLPKEPDEVSVEIGGHVARLVDHGSCLQLGIGAIPDAVLGFLTEKRHLGVHSEMFSDGMLPLLENGNVDNSRKAVHRGKTVASFVMGTRQLYDFVDDNPSIEFHPSDHVNDPRVIARNDGVVAVNSALQVDLTGQVCADSLGYRFYSGIGGQVDFIRGAAMSRGGKPIIALPSTAQGGSVSRIVPHLDEGAGVVTSRGDVHYVVTEFGVAYLHGKTIRERALALINIAHPDFRRELLDFVKGKHYVYEDEQVWEQAVNRYPAEWETTFAAGGRELFVRPLRATDERLYQEFFYGHSPETVHERYFVAKSALSHPEAAHLCCVDWERRMAFGAFENRGPAERFVAVAQYELNPRTNRAEVGIVVREDLRRRGIARFLFERLVAYARSKGISGIHTEVLSTNHAMLELHRALGHRVRWDREAGIYTVQHDLAEEPQAQAVDAESPVGAEDR